MEAKLNSIYKERIIDLEHRISRLGILGKAYYELAQIKLKRHHSQISIAKTQNLLLHATLDTLREKDRAARKHASDLGNLQKTTASLRIDFDYQRNLLFKRQAKLELQITGTHLAELQCAGVLDPNTPIDIRIRTLEHRLVLIQKKLHGVRVLVKQYEATLIPFREEWTRYNSKLAALQIHVNKKAQECEVLINTHHEAVRARDAAKIELEELLGYLFGYGKKIQGLIPPDLRAHILRAIKEIKIVMSVGSMREMYHEYIVQEKQSTYLQSIYDEMRRMKILMENHQNYPVLSRKRTRTSKRSNAADVAHFIGGSTMIVRRQSAMSHIALKGAYPLIQLLEGTQQLVDKLQSRRVTLFQHLQRPSNHTSVKIGLTPSCLKVESDSFAKEILDQCEEKLVFIVQGLYRVLKRKNKEVLKRAGAELEGSQQWRQEEAEISKKCQAAEEARRKFVERGSGKGATALSFGLSQKGKGPQVIFGPIINELETPRSDFGIDDFDLTTTPQIGVVSHATYGHSITQLLQVTSDSQKESLLVPQHLKEAEGNRTMIFLPDFQADDRSASPDFTRGKSQIQMMTRPTVISDVKTPSTSSSTSIASTTMGPIDGPASTISSSVTSLIELIDASPLENPNPDLVAIPLTSLASNLVARPLATSTPILITDQVASPTESLGVGPSSLIPIASPSISSTTSQVGHADIIPRNVTSTSVQNNPIKEQVQVSLKLEFVGEDKEEIGLLSKASMSPVLSNELSSQTSSIASSTSERGYPKKQEKIIRASIMCIDVTTKEVSISSDESQSERMEKAVATQTRLSPIEHAHLDTTKTIGTKKASDTVELQQGEGLPSQQSLRGDLVPQIVDHSQAANEIESRGKQIDVTSLMSSTMIVDKVEKLKAESADIVKGENDESKVVRATKLIPDLSLSSSATVQVSNYEGQQDGQRTLQELIMEPLPTAPHSQHLEQPPATRPSPPSIPQLDISSIAKLKHGPLVTATEPLDLQTPRASAQLDGIVVLEELPREEDRLSIQQQSKGYPPPEKQPAPSLGMLPSPSRDVLKQRAALADSMLPRSPSGAPIASGAQIPIIEDVPCDDSSSQKSTSSGLRSPNLPRSPSGAPIATAVKFPLEPLIQANDKPHESTRSPTSSRAATSSSLSIPSSSLSASSTSIDSPLSNSLVPPIPSSLLVSSLSSPSPLALLPSNPSPSAPSSSFPSPLPLFSPPTPSSPPSQSTILAPTSSPTPSSVLVPSFPPSPPLLASSPTPSSHLAPLFPVVSSSSPTSLPPPSFPPNPSSPPIPPSLASSSSQAPYSNSSPSFPPILSSLPAPSLSAAIAPASPISVPAPSHPLTLPSSPSLASLSDGQHLPTSSSSFSSAPSLSPGFISHPTLLDPQLDISESMTSSKNPDNDPTNFLAAQLGKGDKSKVAEGEVPTASIATSAATATMASEQILAPASVLPPVLPEQKG